MPFKECVKCGEWKEHNPSQHYCPECHTAAARRTSFRKRYGITPEEYDTMYFLQDGCCKICDRHSTEFKRQLAVDHCHETGKVRGLLCTNCNTAIGKFQDDEDLLLRAISYLREANKGRL